MNRRVMLGGIMAVALAAPAFSQQARKKIGFISWFSDKASAHLELFRKGMEELGYIDGQNVVIEGHFTAGDHARTRNVVRKMVEDKVDIFVAVTTPAIAIVKEEAGLLPIVMASVADPVGSGLAQSLARPGFNLTGRTMFGSDLAGKRLDLLMQMKPELHTIAFLGSSAAATTAQFVKETQAVTDRLGVKLLVRVIKNPTEITADLLQTLQSEGAEAVIVHPILTTYEQAILPLANAANLPVVADYIQFAKAGAILTYGIDVDANIRRAAYFVDRILKGASPGDLPIEQPTETKLVINLVAAKRFGWIIPPTLLASADEVIE